MKQGANRRVLSMSGVSKSESRMFAIADLPGKDLLEGLCD